MKRQFVAMSGLVLLLNVSSLTAGVPGNLTYQGRLLDAAGDAVTNGNYLIQFRIYDAETAGTTLWNSSFREIAITDGLFSYNLGDTVAMPHDLFLKYSSLWLGIRVGTGLELAPRIKLTSSGFAYQALRSDSAQNSVMLQGQPAGYYIDWINLTNVPSGFADGVDNIGSGDVTAVTAGMGLIGGGASGSLTVNVGPGSGILVDNDSIYIAQNSIGQIHLSANSVGSSEINDGAIVNADISGAADIAPTKIAGTAVNLNSAQTITGSKTFDDLNVATTTRRLAIAPPAFQTTGPGSMQIMYSLAIGLSPAGIGSFSFTASVSLPDGATVTQLEGYFFDMDAGDWDLRLARIDPSTNNSVQFMADVNTVGSSGFTNPSDTLIDSATIDNENYIYALLIQGSMLNGSSIFQFYGAEIEYTITRPLP